MNERLNLSRGLGLNHKLDVREVEPTCSYVGRDDDGYLATLEISVNFFAVNLFHISMKHGTTFSKLFAKLVHSSFGFAENDGFAIP